MAFITDMLLGPIYNIELVTASRRRRYFFLRVLYGVVILFVLWTNYQSYSGFYNRNQTGSIQQAAELATTFFYSFSWLQMLAILFVGPALAAGTIATERERRTIEYLFTTDLRNHEIVLGKLLAKLTILGHLVLVGLPVLFIFRLLGGIPANLLVATFLLAGSTALMLASVSLSISVWSSRARDATVRVYSVLAAIFILPTILAGYFASQASLQWLWQNLVEPVTTFCMKINPIWSLGMAMQNRFALGAAFDLSPFLETVGHQLLVALVSIVWATIAVRRVHLRESSRGETKSKKLQNFRLPLWRPSMGKHPMRWKEMFAGTAKSKLGLVGNVALGLILLTVIGFAVYKFLGCAYSVEKREF